MESETRMREFKPVQSVTVRLITDKPVKKTPYQVKGVFMRQFPDEPIIPMLDGRYRDKFLYPRIQVKILNEQIYITGINEGAEPVLSIAKKFEFLDFGNITFQVVDMDVEEYHDRFQPSSKLIRYRFITPWVALNATTGNRYRHLSTNDRLAFLNRLLGQNIVFLAREMGMELEDNVYTKVSLDSSFPKPVDENNWGAFYGEFRTNFVLPNYIGLGNGITRGYGSIYGLFNPDLFTFDEASLKKSTPKQEPEEISPDDDSLEEIKAKDVPKPRKRTTLVRKTKKIFSEEFELEESVPRRSNKKTGKAVKEQKKNIDDDFDDDSKFNRSGYHEKQHDL